MKKRIITFIIGLGALTALVSGCSITDSDADVASYNLSKSAEQFEVLRRVVLFNGITGENLLAVDGLCSIEDQWNYGARQLEVTCKIGDGEYEKHFLGISDNVSYFVRQLQVVDVSVNFRTVIFKPQTLLPNFQYQFNDKGEAEVIEGDSN